MSAYDELLLQQQLQNGGTLALPYVRRSAYLAQALDAIGKSGENVKTPGALMSNLLAQALLQYGRSRNDKKLADAEKLDRDQTLAQWNSIFAQPPTQDQAQPPPAPPPPPAPQAPAPQPMASTGPPPDWNGVGRSVEMMSRLLMGEAGGNDAGQKAVASVVMNRANQSGLSPDQVMLAPHQFEPLNNPRTRARLEAISTDDPRFQRALGNLTSVLNNGPTTNADHFWSPTAQAALGRQPPAWASPGQNIGGNVFTHNGYSAPPGMQPQQQPPAPMMASLPSGTQQAAYQSPAPAPLPPAQGTPPPAPTAPGAGGGNPPMPQVRGLESITPQQRALVAQLLGSNDPRERQRGQMLMQELLKQAASPIDWQETTTNGVPVFWNKQNPRQQFVGSIPPGAMSHVVNGQQAGIPGAPQGTMFNQSPTGEVTSAYAPPQGFQSGPGGQQSYVPGGPNDPTRGMNLVQGEGALRQRYDAEIQPTIDALQGYQKVLQAVRTGTPAGDIALVFAYMKTLDPGSTVREGEQATVQNSGTIPQTILNTYNQLVTGQGRLSPAQRRQFAHSAYQQAQVYAQRGAQLNERYGSMARDYGYNPAHIIQPFGKLEAPPALANPAQQQDQAPQAAPGTVGTWKGGYPVFTPAQAAAAAKDPSNRGKHFYIQGNPQLQVYE